MFIFFFFFHSQGRTFAKIINDFIDIYRPLNETYIADYNTKEGRKIYDDTLACVKEQFPHYLKEIEGNS